MRLGYRYGSADFESYPAIENRVFRPYGKNDMQDLWMPCE